MGRWPGLVILTTCLPPRVSVQPSASSNRLADRWFRVRGKRSGLPTFLPSRLLAETRIRRSARPALSDRAGAGGHERTAWVMDLAYDAQLSGVRPAACGAGDSWGL